MYVNAPAYQTVYTYKISVAGYFEQIQAFSLSDMASELVPTAGFAVSRSGIRWMVWLDDVVTDALMQGQAVYQK